MTAGGCSGRWSGWTSGPCGSAKSAPFPAASASAPFWPGPWPRALAQGAGVLLLDEPFSGVDINTERLIIDLLIELRDQGATVLIATHDLESIPSFCDRVVLINRTVLAYGDTSEVFTQANLLRTFTAAPSSSAPG